MLSPSACNHSLVPPPLFALDPTIVEQVAKMLQEKGRDWIQLRTLYIVDKCRTLYRAAPVLGLGGVAPVRNRIRTLEKNLNLDLLITDGTGSRITPEGRAVIELIRSEFADDA